MDSSKKKQGRHPLAKVSSNSRSDSPSTVTKPPPRAQGTIAGHPVPARAQRRSKYIDDREGQEDANTIEEGVDDADGDSDEWMEVEDDDEAENDTSDEMPDPSFGQDNKEDDDDDVVQVTKTQM